MSHANESTGGVNLRHAAGRHTVCRTLITAALDGKGLSFMAEISICLRKKMSTCTERFGLRRL